MNALEDMVNYKIISKSYYNGHKIVLADFSHIPYLSANIRKEDLIEIECGSGTPTNAFMTALANDDMTYTALDAQGTPYAMFGAGDVGIPYIWMLGTNDVKKYKMFFLKTCKEWVNRLIINYGKVTNYVHINNKLAINWLKWCGAEFHEQIELKGEKFYRFTIEVKNNV